MEDVFDLVASFLESRHPFDVQHFAWVVLVVYLWLKVAIKAATFLFTGNHLSHSHLLLVLLAKEWGLLNGVAAFVANLAGHTHDIAFALYNTIFHVRQFAACPFTEDLLLWWYLNCWLLSLVRFDRQIDNVLIVQHLPSGLGFEVMVIWVIHLFIQLAAVFHFLGVRIGRLWGTLVVDLLKGICVRFVR